MAQIEQKELEGHRDEIIADVKKLVEKYRKIFDWDVPDIDQTFADKLIVLEVRKALDDLEHIMLGRNCLSWFDRYRGDKRTFADNPFHGQSHRHQQSCRAHDGPVQKETSMTPLLSLVVYMAIVYLGLSACCQSNSRRGVDFSRHDARDGKSRQPSSTQSACRPCRSCSPKHGGQLYPFRRLGHCRACRRRPVAEGPARRGSVFLVAPSLPCRLLRWNSDPAHGGLGREHRRPSHDDPSHAAGAVNFESGNSALNYVLGRGDTAG